MNFGNEEFQFALELIIAGRNENGATLSDIRDDYYNVFGTSFESMFGNFWTVEVQNLLLNSMNTTFSKTLPGGYVLFFVKVTKLKEKIMAVSECESMMAILHMLKIDPNSIKKYRGQVQGPAQSSFNSLGPNSVSTLSSNRSTVGLGPKSTEFYNHTLIADNFFLELSHIDLKMEKRKKNNIERIGLCISGQTLKSAYGTISYGSYKFNSKNVILNIGTFDLLNGRSVANMVADFLRLLNAIKKKDLQPILTTLAPMPPHLDGELEENRQLFNKFIRDNNFNVIDIEQCFLSNGKRVLLECYQPVPKEIGGSRHAVTLWNRVGRQRVLQQLKREIPNFHSFF